MVETLTWERFASAAAGLSFRDVRFHQMPDRAALYAGDPEGLAAALRSHLCQESAWRVIKVNPDGPVQPDWSMQPVSDPDPDGDPREVEIVAHAPSMKIVNLDFRGAALAACDRGANAYIVVPSEECYRRNPSLNRSLVLVLSEPFRVMAVPMLVGKGGAALPDTEAVARACDRSSHICN